GKLRNNHNNFFSAKPSWAEGADVCGVGRHTGSRLEQDQEGDGRPPRRIRWARDHAPFPRSGVHRSREDDVIRNFKEACGKSSCFTCTVVDVLPGPFYYQNVYPFIHPDKVTYLTRNFTDHFDQLAAAAAASGRRTILHCANPCDA
ncbi:unnamed protein product, partial [Prunus brigantina]